MSKPRRLPSAIAGETYFVTSSTDTRERYFIYSNYTELFIDSFTDTVHKESKNYIHSSLCLNTSTP
jgi:hypothetical protein